MQKGYGTMEKSLTKIMNNASLDDIDDNGNGMGKSSKPSKSRSKKKKGSVKKSEASQILHDFVHTDNDFKQRKNKEKRKHSNATMQRVIARRRVKQTKALHKVPAFEKLPNASLDKMADRMKYLKFAPGQQVSDQRSSCIPCVFMCNLVLFIYHPNGHSCASKANRRIDFLSLSVANAGCTWRPKRKTCRRFVSRRCMHWIFWAKTHCCAMKTNGFETPP